MGLCREAARARPRGEQDYSPRWFRRQPNSEDWVYKVNCGASIRKTEFPSFLAEMPWTAQYLERGFEVHDFGFVFISGGLLGGSRGRRLELLS